MECQKSDTVHLAPSRGQTRNNQCCSKFLCFSSSWKFGETRFLTFTFLCTITSLSTTLLIMKYGEPMYIKSPILYISIYPSVVITGGVLKSSLVNRNTMHIDTVIYIIYLTYTFNLSLEKKKKKREKRKNVHPQTSNMFSAGQNMNITEHSSRNSLFDEA